jgi:hypothetical protein
MKITERLKQELWTKYGTKEFPSEWDGFVYGGGKISQRFWEYFITIQMLDLDEDSVLLDIGGGSPKTGMGFFALVLQPFVKKIVIVDPHIEESAHCPENVVYVRQNADTATLANVFNKHSISHVCSVSVLEHIHPETRKEIMRAIDANFKGQALAFTLEFHATQRFFEQQLTTESLTDMVSEMTQFYVSDIQASPVTAMNAHMSNAARLWYPLAVKFFRNVQS